MRRGEPNKGLKLTTASWREGVTGWLASNEERPVLWDGLLSVGRLIASVLVIALVHLRRK
jgi:hypothetical protein